MASEVYLKDTRYSQRSPSNIVEPIAELVDRSAYAGAKLGFTVTGPTLGTPRLGVQRVRVVRPEKFGVVLKVQPDGNDSAREGILELPPGVDADTFTCDLAKAQKEIDEVEEMPEVKPEGSPNWGALRALLRALKEKVEAFRRAETKILEISYELEASHKERKDLEEKLEAVIEKIAQQDEERKRAEAILNDPEYKESIAEFEALKTDLGL